MAVRNITFIIGNGLDLSLGLKTSYRDFYKYIQKTKKSTKNKIYNAIREDPTTWADFETKLGAYTRYIEKLPEKDRRKESSIFHNDLEEFINDLADYLEGQNNLNDVQVGIGRNSFFEGLPSGQFSQFSNYIAGYNMEFSFVTLNYTSTLLKILPQNHMRSVSNIKVRAIHHLHGTLSENMTLGVSDESQLTVALEGDDKNFVIKPKSIEMTNDGRLDNMNEIINNSSIIVLFGTSIGETDKYLWKRILEWLDSDPVRRIIIHKHDNSFQQKTRRVPRRRAIFASEVQDKLLSHSEASDEEKAELRNRIYVVHNTDKLFVPHKSS